MDALSHCQLALHRAEAALGGGVDVLTAPPETDLDAAPPEDDTAEPFAHLVDKDELISGLMNGHYVQAICGHKFIPKLFNPANQPLCEACVKIYGGAGGGPTAC